MTYDTLSMKQIEWTWSVVFGALSKDNFVYLQITDREGLQNVSTSYRGVSSYLSSEHNMFLWDPDKQTWDWCQVKHLQILSDGSPKQSGCPSLSTWWLRSGCPTPRSPRTPRTSWRAWPTPPWVRSVEYLHIWTALSQWSARLSACFLLTTHPINFGLPGCKTDHPLTPIFVLKYWYRIDLDIFRPSASWRAFSGRLRICSRISAASASRSTRGLRGSTRGSAPWGSLWLPTTPGSRKYVSIILATMHNLGI